MSKILSSQISIIGIRYVPDDEGHGSFDLQIESQDCPFFLGGSILIPDDPKIYGEVDIPSFDGRSVETWLQEVKKEWLTSQN